MDDKITFEIYDADALAKSWEWLNDPEIKHLTNTPDFERESQKLWFEGLPHKTDYYIRTVVSDGVKIGVVGLKKIMPHEGEYWGYIGEKSHWGKGAGTKMVKHIIDYAREKKLQSVYLKVLKENKRAVRLYEKMGFNFEKDIDEKEFMMRLYV